VVAWNGAAFQRGSHVRFAYADGVWTSRTVADGDLALLPGTGRGTAADGGGGGGPPLRRD